MKKILKFFLIRSEYSLCSYVLLKIKDMVINKIWGKLPYQERRHLHSKLIKIDDEWDGLRVMAEFEIQNVLLFIS